MVFHRPDPRDVGFYYSLAQVGLEMVAPVAVGVLIDVYLDTRPWAIIIGALLGLVTGFAHLISLLNQRTRAEAERKKREKQ
jgi:F0F1-type ATP synthase assembly protein I